MTKEKFEAFEKVRKSGKTNVFNISQVVRLSGDVLQSDDCLDIMNNYSQYKQKFN